ncbi:uncharacterized protein LOC143572816 [Bidens hawaiensis]|uniref:uncharacterized protein LOC143572816 n=1 Tax=Bidens hawaiensis TaxID=980011 RepID=UPI004048FB02
MRALNDLLSSNFLLRVGGGTEEAIECNFIRIPDDMTISFTTKENSIKELFNAILPLIENNVCTSNYIASRAISSTRNESVDEINDQMLDNFQGDEHVYYSYEVEDDKHHFYPTEFLNALNVSDLPPHKLQLKIVCLIILLRNMDPSRGLNGTRLICKGFHRNAIDTEIIVGQHSGERVFFIRIPLILFEGDKFPFELIRKQFFFRLCFSMTINKAQGQTIPHIGVYLPDSVFSHGKLYVALSGGISRENTNVLVHPAKDFGDGVYTSNVVYPEVLREG